MRTGTVAILFVVIIAIGLFTEAEAKCRGCKRKCRKMKKNNCRMAECLFGAFCICKCGLEQPYWVTASMEQPMRKHQYLKTTGFGDDLVMDNELNNDELTF